MHILTRRCIIRDFQQDDIDRFMEYQNDMGWMRYQGFKGESRKRYEDELLHGSSLDSGKQFALVSLAEKQLIGDVYLRKENDVYWLGYTIHPAYARKGYGEEAARAIIQWVADQNGRMIKAGVLAENSPSIRLLEKLTFAYSAHDGDELLLRRTNTGRICYN